MHRNVDGSRTDNIEQNDRYATRGYCDKKQDMGTIDRILVRFTREHWTRNSMVLAFLQAKHHHSERLLKNASL